MGDSGASRGGVTPINWLPVTLAANIGLAAGARALSAGLDVAGFVRFRGGPIQNNTGAVVAIGVTFATVDISLAPTTTLTEIILASPATLRVTNVLLTGELQLAGSGSTWGIGATMALEGAQYFQAL